MATESEYKLDAVRRRIVKLASENERLEFMNERYQQAFECANETVEKLSALCDLYKKKIAELESTHHTRP